MTTQEKRPAMPPAIVKAIAAVMGELAKLAYSGRNPEGGFEFASIDDFLDAVRPAMAKHELVILQEQEGWEIRPGEGTNSRGNPRPATLVVDYSFTLATPAATWEYRPRRTASVFANMGSQAYGAAQSYAEKLFLRSLFKMSTGAPDIDALPQDDLSAGGDRDFAKTARELYSKHYAALNAVTTLADMRVTWQQALADKSRLLPGDQTQLTNVMRDRSAELKLAEATAPAPKPEAGPEATAQGDEGQPAAEAAAPEPPAPEADLLGPTTVTAPPAKSDDPFANLDELEAAQAQRTAAAEAPIPPGRPGANRTGAK